MKIRPLISFVLLTLPIVSFADQAEFSSPAEANTAQYFDSVKNDSSELLAFLENMPKGGDLHNHLAGLTYPENLITYAKNDKFCIDPKTFAVTTQSDCDTTLVGDLPNHPDLYNQAINAWSLRDFNATSESKHDHFFNTFLKVYPLIGPHNADILTESVNRATAEKINYLELMITSSDLNMPAVNGEDPAAALGKQVGFNNNFAQMRQQIMVLGLPNIVTQLRQKLDKMEATSREQLHCNSNNAMPGCQVKVRYIYFALRILPPAEFFGQMLSAFEIANTDPRVVGVNIVAPEDNYVALRDYDLQMQMIHYLHTVYPNVHISLHAGELSPTLVTPEDLNFHIRDAVEIADTDRIGHGVDIPYEKNPQQLLKEMAQKHILVEMNLTSNAQILGITGNDDPLPLYLRYHVPIVLCTDDAGVLRTDITREYERAILTYHLSYQTIKAMVRNSVTYSFLPGKSLWQNSDEFVRVPECQRIILGSDHLDTACKNFLDHSEKAQMQWQLENEFNKFEKNYE